ncbi:MAG: metallophosphoesterase family protein [Sinobacteraceae bacterium]|nr:metallophosphoesterase family protein [Nevskiaceae bacterium]
MPSARRSSSVSTGAEARLHPDARRVGLISDTHGLLRKEALEALAGVDLIIHAGDIGSADILRSLEQLAPVQAVRGNNDRGAWAAELPDVLDITLAGVAVHVLHDIKTLRLQHCRVQPAVVIAGHSHKPSVAARDGGLYINPGSAGPRRFRLPVTLAFLDIGKNGPRARIEQLL